MIESIASIATFSAFARNGEYLAPDEGAEWVEVRVILDLSIEAYDQYGKLIIDTDEADFPSGLNTVLRKNGTLRVAGYDGMQWRLLSRREDDGYIVKWAIQREEA